MKDDRIESTITQSYVFKTYLKNEAIKPECKNGVATLTGTVSETSHRALAQDTVGDFPGVKIVCNKLTVKGEGPAVHSDPRIALRVKTALLFHSNVRAIKTDVNEPGRQMRSTRWPSHSPRCCWKPGAAGPPLSRRCVSSRKRRFDWKRMAARRFRRRAIRFLKRWPRCRRDRPGPFTASALLLRERLTRQWERNVR